MFCLDYHLFVNLLRFCDKSHLFPLLLTSKEIKELTWFHLVDFLKINLQEVFYKNYMKRKLDVVKYLIKDFRVDPSHLDNYYLFCSSLRNDTKIVKILLQDSRVHPNNCIWWTSFFNILDVLKLFLQDYRINEETKEYYRTKHNIIN